MEKLPLSVALFWLKTMILMGLGDPAVYVQVMLLVVSCTQYSLVEGPVMVMSARAAGKRARARAAREKRMADDDGRGGEREWEREKVVVEGKDPAGRQELRDASFHALFNSHARDRSVYS